MRNKESLVEQILPNAQRKPVHEVVWPGHTSHFDNGDALGSMGTIYYCFQTPLPPVELHLMPRHIMSWLNMQRGWKDLLMILHGPAGWRASSVPTIGREGTYHGWHGHTLNDGEVTFISSLSQEKIMDAIDRGIKSGIALDLKLRKGITHFTEILESDWKQPNWNPKEKSSDLPTINPYKKTSYTYWKDEVFPAYDFHFIDGESANPIDEFLTIYEPCYSNVVGLPMLVCFVNEYGKLEQRIWRPFKPERGRSEHFIRLTKPEELSQLPWVIPEAARVALTTEQLSVATGKPARIHPNDMDILKSAVHKQAALLRQSGRGEWLKEKGKRKIGTFIHRAGLIGGKESQQRLVEILDEMHWGETILEKRVKNILKEIN